MCEHHFQMQMGKPKTHLFQEQRFDWPIILEWDVVTQPGNDGAL